MAFRRIRILLLFGLVCFPLFLSERLLTPRGTGPRLPVVFPEYGESSLKLNLKFLCLFSLPTVYDYNINIHISWCYLERCVLDMPY